MESRRCFMGLSSRIEEGLSGNLVLASGEERFYSGQPLDTLFTSSEILQGLTFIPDLASEEGFNNILRMKIKRFSKRALDIYKKDPAQFNERVEEMRRELSGICGGNPGLMRHWDSMTEKSSRMVKRTIRKAKDSGTNP